METVEVVIRIPEEWMDQFKAFKHPSTLETIIMQGTVLPKGHGRLIDSDLLDKRLNFVLNHTGGYKKTPIGTGIVIAMAENLDAPTIIEADTESEE